jgi:DNA-binding NarL/FixJ family response regulator
MPKNSHHADPIWENQVALLGPELDERARLLRELCPDVTVRESQVAALSAKGLDNGHIAERLFISPSTVDNHTSHARLKTDIPTDLKFRNLIQFVEDRHNKTKIKPRIS